MLCWVQLGNRLLALAKFPLYFEFGASNGYNEEEITMEKRFFFADSRKVDENKKGGIGMGYQALYRAWRPLKFEDVIGQEHIAKTLQNALLKEKTSHAYLFTGPRGTGKTSAAKIIAKTINCEQAPAAEPCNECAACRGITDGSVSDVIEIDAASNNGVDEIRDVRDKVKYAPSAVQYKVYIIDEVHMLSTGAFNALLKTLEEPPKHVLFILATTEPHKIPLTIISRCQRFDFRRIPDSAIVKRLEKITEAISAEVDEAALKMVAKASDGGMRDALSLLDQTLSYSDGRVTLDDVLSITGAVSQQFLSKVAEAIAEKDVVTALDSVEQLLQQGKDPARFLEDLIYYYRDMLLYQTSSELEEVMERAKADEAFRKLAEATEKSSIYDLISILNRSQQDMKWTNHPRIFLELSLVNLCQDEKVEKAAPASQADETLLQRIDKLEHELKQLKQQGAPTKSAPHAEPEKRKPFKSAGRGIKVETARIQSLLEQATKQDLRRLKSKWGDVMEKLRQQKISAHACLIDSQPVACSRDTFLLAFKYEIHCQMVNDNKNSARDTVENITEEVHGNHLTMLTVPFSEWEKLKEAYIQKQRRETPQDDDDQEDPLVVEAEKLVGSELVEIKE
jgi:DNA polymerase-3 subunit gamma/tau